MNFPGRESLAALGIVLMQTSIAFTEYSFIARVGALSLGLGLIVVAALMSSALLSRDVFGYVALLLLACAISFEALSAFIAFKRELC